MLDALKNRAEKNGVSEAPNEAIEPVIRMPKWMESGLESEEKILEAAYGKGYRVPPRPNTFTRLELITPERAEEFKLRMGPNRNLQESHLAPLIRAMEQDRFFSTNQGIGISVDGQTVDGQHRIEGIIRTGKPQWINVTYNLTQEAVKAIDNNRIRSFANDLQMAGEESSNEKAAATRLIAKVELAWEKDYSIASFTNLKFDRMELEEWYEVIGACVDLSESVRKGAVLYRRGSGGLGISRSASAAFYYFASAYHDGEFADRFIERLGEGLGLAKGDPELAMRNRAASLMASPRTIDNIEYLAYLIQTYNKAVQGTKVQRIDLPKNGKMPRIIGYSG